MCWLEEPDSFFKDENEPPQVIQTDQTDSLEIKFNEYILTDFAECGEVVYDLVITSVSDASFEPFIENLAHFDGLTLTLTNFSEYPEGILTIVLNTSNIFDGL